MEEDMKATRTAALSSLILSLAGTGASGQLRPVHVVETGILELQRALEADSTTSVQLVEAYLARIRAYDLDGPRLNAIIRLNSRAREEAAALDRERRETGPRGPLHGIPVLVKDNYDVAGMETSAGSLGLASLVPPDDAKQIAMLRAAGAIILGKTNLHELAAGITTVSSLGGQTRNPYDPSRNPGGSSGGTAAAVAASFAAVGWGTDTCGSIRIPAAYQSLFGLRPTKGLSSIDGIVPLAHTQDVAGPLARSATDLAIALDATVGPDPSDPATKVLEGRTQPRFVASLSKDALRGRRIGVLNSRFGRAGGSRETDAVVRAALVAMGEAGADVVDITMPGLDTLIDTSSLIRHEFKFDLADYLAAFPDAPVHSLREILDRGLEHEALEERFRDRDRPESRDTEASRAARAAQTELRRRLLETFEREHLDAIAYPTMYGPPERIGDPQNGSSCQIAAHSGLPSISVPAGFSEDLLPVGVELLGQPFADAELVAMAYAYEQLVHPRRPPTTTPELVYGRAPQPATLRVVTDPVAADSSAGGLDVQTSFRYDAPTGVLQYAVVVRGVTPGDVLAIVLGGGTEERDGPVLHRLSGPGLAVASGGFVLPGRQLEDLRAGRLWLRVFTRAEPLGAFRGRIVFE
jgi:Asp-tRNA(Asn)/Glu-tRNA(Gln) amidotransferase A subunit family amidase